MQITLISLKTPQSFLVLFSFSLNSMAKRGDLMQNSCNDGIATNWLMSLMLWFDSDFAKKKKQNCLEIYVQNDWGKEKTVKD